jgi:hypothetical protein
MEKQITIIKMMTKINIKIKFQGMKLKKKYSKQNIYKNKKFEEQIFHNFKKMFSV